MGLLCVGFPRAYIESSNPERSKVLWIYEKENAEISINVFVSVGPYSKIVTSTVERYLSRIDCTLPEFCRYGSLLPLLYRILLERAKHMHF